MTTVRTTNNPDANSTTPCWLVEGVFRSFDEKDIQYCVWKGTDAIERGLAGHDDLDVLIRKQDLQSALSVLSDNRFKLATSTSGLNTPGVFHYYGYDLVNDRLVHIHLYTRLLTGESLVLTHWLPLESMLLDYRVRQCGVYTASREAELAVFTIRMLIKSRSLFEFLWFGNRSREMADKVELLLKGTDLESSCSLLEKHYPAISRDLLRECVEELRERRSIARRWFLGRQIHRRVRANARFGILGRLRQYIYLSWTKLLRVLTRKARKTVGEGIVIAFAGADASGKSTLISNVCDWLHRDFVTYRVHVGKPPSTWLTIPFHLVVPFARRVFPRHRKATTKAHNPTQAPSILQAVRAVALAWERRCLIRKVHRIANSGAIVICDRYTSNSLGAMDSPRLGASGSGKALMSRLVHLLASLEKRLYQSNPCPDVVVRLTVSIATAKRRNEKRNKSDKHTDADLVDRHRSFRLWSTQGKKSTIEIETEGDISETVKAVREAIWKMV